LGNGANWNESLFIMEIITTHISADFDCLASMVAAQKLYPDAQMVFSGAVEKAPREYLKAFGEPHQIAKARDIDLDRVTRLVVVDTQDPERIGIFNQLLGKEGVDVHVYDHHLDVVNPLAAHQTVVRKRGSCVTILCEELAERDVELSPQESTLLALGIYQDTHSLISPSSTPEDFQAVGQLVAAGADLNVVADYVEPRLNSEQLDVMNEWIKSLEIVNVNGVDVALAQAAVDYYVGDLAVVLHRMMELEGLQAAFAVVALENRVYLIGRSRTEEINVAHILRAFGGGGHAYAASASASDLTLIQARHELLTHLSKNVEPIQLVRDVMHQPVISLKSKDTVHKAEADMTKFNLNTLPVLSGKKPVGLVTRQVVEKAIHHKMTKEPVEEIMVREFSVTTPDAFFKTLVPVIIEDKQKVVPVVHSENGYMIGIVSRGDLLRVLHKDMARYTQEPYASLLEPGDHFVKNVKSLMNERLPREIIHMLETVSDTADELDCGVYMVGGFVRDLLLRNENLDLDIVVEGDGISFARALSRKLGGRMVGHEKFGTSVVILPNGFKLDVATARTEYYKHPGALPTVEKSSIKSDLFRRDFTFNSLAVKLNGKGAFTLIDYFNGQRDLKGKVVRVLHNLSFVEDPCRAFRAVRFEQRLGFQMGRQTESFLKRAVQKNLVDKLSGVRLFNELVLMLKEKQPVQCLNRMKALGLLQVIHPKIMKGGRNGVVLERIEEVMSMSKIVTLVEDPEIWFVYFLGLLYGLDKRDLNRVASRLSLSAKIKNRTHQDLAWCDSVLKTLKRKKKFQPSEIYNLFSESSNEAVLLMMAVSGNDRINKYVLLYFTQYHPSAALDLTGDDLIRLGLKPGPVFQTVFQTLREARLNGQVRTREEEEALVRRRFLCAERAPGRAQDL